jgi:hypothetical protein
MWIWSSILWILMIALCPVVVGSKLVPNLSSLSGQSHPWLGLQATPSVLDYRGNISCLTD